MLKASRKMVSLTVICALLTGVLLSFFNAASAEVWTEPFQSPMGMKPLMEELLFEKEVGAWTERNQEVQDFPWHTGGYYDDAYHDFTHMTWGSWDSFPRYILMGEYWGGSAASGIGMGRITDSGIMLKGASYRRYITLTFTAPVTAKYSISGADISLEKTGPANALGVYTIGFSIHKTSKSQVNIDPCAVTRIWPKHREAQYLSQATESFAMPEISSVYLKAGEALRFVADYSRLPDSYDWDATGVTLCPVVKPLPPFSVVDGTAVCTTGCSVQGTLRAVDPEGSGSVSFVVKDAPSKGTVVIEKDGRYTYTAGEAVSGTDSFTFTAQNAYGASAEGRVEVTLVDNQAPQALDGAAKTKKNTPVSFTLNAGDDKNAPLTYSSVNTTAHGTAALVGNTVTYTPDADFAGLDVLSFTANDGEFDSELAHFRIAVLGDQKLNATQSLKNALTESAGGETDTFFDFSSDREWSFQYRFFGTLGDLDNLESDCFIKAKTGKIYGWGGYSVSDGGTHPSMTIQGAGFLDTDAICSMHSGYTQDSRCPTAALTYTAAHDGTYFITASDVTDQIGIWQGRGQETPVEIWAEAEGVTVWPENGGTVTLDAEQETAEMPDILVSLKAGSSVYICMSGVLENGDDNIVFADADAYDMGAYDAKLDPALSPKDITKAKWVYTDPYADLIVANEMEIRALNDSSAPFIVSLVYKISENFITETVPVKAGEFKGNLLSEPSNLKIFRDEQEISFDADVGTGMTVKLYIGGTEKDAKTIVVRGDVNGDGAVSAIDLTGVKKHLLGMEPLSGARLEAAKTTGSEVSVIDLVVLKKYIVER